MTLAMDKIKVRDSLKTDSFPRGTFMRLDCAATGKDVNAEQLGGLVLVSLAANDADWASFFLYNCIVDKGR